MVSEKTRSGFGKMTWLLVEDAGEYSIYPSPAPYPVINPEVLGRKNKIKVFNLRIAVIFRLHLAKWRYMGSKSKMYRVDNIIQFNPESRFIIFKGPITTGGIQILF
jgi:hypothetical protein